jgi:membrane-bound metal-dependent hydrolase YbcI (DUF457 family)
MFLGHYGVGLGAKKIDNRPSLGTLLMAAQFIDLLWPIFLLLGLEKVVIEPGNTVVTPLNFTHYPITHSLFGVVIWALLFGIVYYLIKKNRKTSLLLGVLVISHWVLDLIVHRPDLLLWPTGGIKVGFGLWNSLIGTIIVEGLIFIGGAYFYLKTTKAQNKKGLVGLWSLLIFLILVYVMNLIGPPPDSVNAIAIVGLSQWIIILWGYWIDKNRTVNADI